MIDLDELELLAKAATPGPWKFRSIKPVAVVIVADNTPIATTNFQINKTHDAEYIVAACNVVPELMARVRELERQREFFLKALNGNRLCPNGGCFHDGSDLDEWDCTATDNRECWINAAKEKGE